MWAVLVPGDSASIVPRGTDATGQAGGGGGGGGPGGGPPPPPGGAGRGRARKDRLTGGARQRWELRLCGCRAAASGTRRLAGTIQRGEVSAASGVGRRVGGWRQRALEKMEKGT
jgi:hypothetical protein